MIVFTEQIANTAIAVKDINAGQCFRRNNYTGICMRLKPTSYILNSNLVADSMSAGKALIANIETGTCFFIDGSELVWLKHVACKVN